MLSCARNCGPGDIVLLKGNPYKYLVAGYYINELHADYPQYGSGYIEVINLHTHDPTKLVYSDIKRLDKIIKYFK